METSKTKLGVDHPDTLTSMHNLAFTWRSLGRGAEAIALMQQCVRQRSQVLQDVHPDLVSSLQVLEQWEAEEAEAEAKEAEAEEATETDAKAASGKREEVSAHSCIA